MKRKLFPNEINTIINSIPSFVAVSPDISQNNLEGIQRNLKHQLEQIQIHPEMIPKLQQTLFDQYYSSQIQPGESVGIITAQSIGERCTQWTLNSFHYAGSTISTVVTGVPRFAELLSASKNSKSNMTKIYTKQDNESITLLRKLLSHSIHCLYFADIIESSEIFSNGEKYESWYNLYDDIDFKDYTLCISYKLSLEILFKYKLSLSAISKMIQESYSDVICVFSPQIYGQIDIWVSTTDLLIPEIPEYSFVDDTNKEYVFVQNMVMPSLRNIKLCGISGLGEFIFQEEKDKSWYIEVLGNNLPEIANLYFVDMTRTISNNMWEIFTTLGIEAVNEFLIQEFYNVICSDSFVNLRHIQLLVDVMTYTGSILSINRYGVQRDQSGPLTKASFEESLDNFLQAGVYGDIENTRGVSASIMCGKPAKMGTGVCSLIYRD